MSQSPGTLNDCGLDPVQPGLPCSSRRDQGAVQSLTAGPSLPLLAHPDPRRPSSQLRAPSPGPLRTHSRRRLQSRHPRRACGDRGASVLDARGTVTPAAHALVGKTQTPCVPDPGSRVPTRLHLLTSETSGNSSQKTLSFKLNAKLCAASCLFWKERKAKHQRHN